MYLSAANGGTILIALVVHGAIANNISMKMGGVIFSSLDCA